MRTIWLASYPKSGNTWFRMLLGNLSAVDETPADINDLPERGGIASSRLPFDHLLLIDSGLLTPDEIDCLRPRVYEALARGEEDDEYDAPQTTNEIRFVKIHDAYTLTPKGEPLLAGARGADGAILIVRDPRDVASSQAHHNNDTLDKAIDLLTNSISNLSSGIDRQQQQFRQRLNGWSGHAQSWLDQTDIPVHLVRYEDLKDDTVGVFRQALAFAGREATDEAIERAVRLADFEKLQAQEKEKGFREAPRPWTEARFFRRGQSGAWRTELTREQVERIETAHAPMMRRLGYELASETKGAAA
jgi:hypothetical protein